MKPPIFLDLDLPAALARAKDQKRPLVVAVVSKRYPRCETMDQFTWIHPGLVARMTDRVLAIKVDGDADPALVETLKVRAMPTTIAFEDGAEVDRVMGVLQGEKIIDWLDAIDRGETHIAQLRREAYEHPKQVYRRMDLAAALFNAQAYDEATTENVWLWKHMVEHMPQMLGIKHHVFVDELRKLIDVHPPSRDAFGALRDATVPDLDDVNVEELTDWCSLNRALGETAKTLAWFDEHRASALGTPAVARALEPILEPLLIEAERWSDLGRLYQDPVTAFLQKANLHTQVLAEREQMKAAHAANPQLAADAGLNPVSLKAAMELTLGPMKQALRDTAQKLTRALLAAGRKDEAKQIAEAAVAADGSPEMAKALEPLAKSS